MSAPSVSRRVPGGGQQGARKPPRLCFALLVLGLAVATVRAADATTYAVSLQRVVDRGRSQVAAWVSVRDSLGNSIAGLGRDFQVALGDGPWREVSATPYRDRCPGVDWVVVLDPAVLVEADRSVIQDALRGLSARTRNVDAVFVAVADGSGRVRRWRDGERIVSSANPAEPRLVDALAGAAELCGRRPQGRGCGILLLTCGRDGASRCKPSEVFARVRDHDPPTPITVAIVGRPGEEIATAGLEGLAAATGGVVVHLSSPTQLAAAVANFVQQPSGRYELGIGLPAGFDRRCEHRLRVRIGRGPGGSVMDAAFLLGAPPRKELALGWPWLLAASLLLGLAIVFRPGRPVCRLVVLGGPENGCRYDVYQLPVSLGAADDNHILFDEPTVSRHHAVLERRDGVIQVRDENSEFRTRVNDGEPIHRQPLSDGDVIQLGTATQFVFQQRRWWRP